MFLNWIAISDRSMSLHMKFGADIKVHNLFPSHNTDNGYKKKTEKYWTKSRL